MGKSENNETTPSPPLPLSKAHGHRFRAWFIGILLLFAVVAAVTHLGEIEHFAQLAEQARPKWLLVALLLQAGTYVCTAAVWYQTLRYAQVRYSLLSLLPLSLAKLFSDQAVPSGGASGASFFVAALKRRAVPMEVCMAILLVSLVTYYTAYLIAALTSVGLLWFYHAIDLWIVAVVGVFCLVAAAIPAGALWMQHWRTRALPTVLMRSPGLRDLLQGFRHAPSHLLRNPSLVAKVTVFQAAVFLLDAATLWAMLHAVGQDASLLVAFPSFMVASIVATLSPVPLGLGTFEASSVGMLNALGVPVEAGLTATLLLRGFTLWLPMLPGLWLARRELR
jgi:uncharacterized protein (TIRG00374 family)